MTTGTRSQAAGAGAAGPTPASPRQTRYAPELLCGAKIHGTAPGITLKPGEPPRVKGQPCTQRKGWGTTHPGIGRCKFHGGRSITHRIRAAKQQIANELRVLAMPTDVNPIQSLYDAVRVAAWREAGLRAMLQQRTSLAGPDHLGDARPDVIWQMHDVALKRKAEIASMAVNAGLDARMVELAERESDVLFRCLEDFATAAGVSVDLREKGYAAVRARLDDVIGAAPVGAELS